MFHLEPTLKVSAVVNASVESYALFKAVKRDNTESYLSTRTHCRGPCKRLILSSSSSCLPFLLIQMRFNAKRREFPVHLAFSTTSKMSKGQTSGRNLLISSETCNQSRETAAYCSLKEFESGCSLLFHQKIWIYFVYPSYIM
jgi:hypothetical protein